MTAARIEPYTLPIADRPQRTWGQTLNAILFGITFNVGCLVIHSIQVVILMPLLVLPFGCTKHLYQEGVRYTKGSFATLLILMNQCFAPTRLSVTFEREGQGHFTDEQIEAVVVRDKDGNVTALNLPTKSILIANHQMYADWWYAWCLTYFMGTHKDVFIVLKKSLKWIPVIGWAMQFFNFIFLARSWASDRIELATHLSKLGQQAETEDKPLTLIIYPEGTLVSKDTRPISKKFADKMGIPDMTNILLPRSTGLHYSLRSLASRIPSLHLIDLTIVYPGIPAMKYGQSYYTLRSIFFDRVPPPVIHIHLRVFDVSKDVPIGNMDQTTTPKSSNLTDGQAVEFPEEEKTNFDLWLRELWREKDRLIMRYHETGSFAGEGGVDKVVDIPLKLRHKREVVDVFCFIVPTILGYIWTKLRVCA